MSKLIMMRGLPRSGKSTWVKEFVKNSGNATVVSRDDLRVMLHCGKWTPRNEKVTMSAQKALVEHLLKTTQTVIVDDTNLGEYHEARWKNIAKECGASFEIHEEKESDLRQLIRRDDISDSKRGADVIVRMAMANGFVAFENDSVVVCDLDGTLCDIAHRRQYVEGVKKDWQGFFSGIAEDTLREEVYKQLKQFVAEGKRIIFASGRPENHRAVTENWLKENGFELEHREVEYWDGLTYFALLMRPANDTRTDVIVKQEILNKYLKKEWIHTVIDDRPSVIEMWRKNGLTVIDVGNGEYF
jgi:predicted kinase